jgi:DNA polymerase-3 subunit epsilon/oligoribonuclease
MQAIFLDLETTGLDPVQHAVIDIAFKIVNLRTNEIQASYQSVVKQPKEIWEHQDPVSLEINGYTSEQVAGGKTPQIIREEIVALFSQLGIVRGQAVFICQNPGFDRAFFNQLIEAYTQEKMNWPYHWLDLASMFWTQMMQGWLSTGQPIPTLMNLSKDSIASHFQLPPEVSPHRALNGVNHLMMCYQAVFGIHFVEHQSS